MNVTNNTRPYIDKGNLFIVYTKSLSCYQDKGLGSIWMTKDDTIYLTRLCFTENKLNSDASEAITQLTPGQVDGLSWWVVYFFFLAGL